MTFAPRLSPLAILFFVEKVWQMYVKMQLHLAFSFLFGLIGIWTQSFMHAR
jgi:hypothetical protein